MSPKRADLVLTANIPDIELYVFVCDGLDVETDSWNCGDILVQLQFVKNC